MKLSKSSGVAIAATAAFLLVSGAVGVQTAGAQDAKVKCYGVNACKGQSACKTASSQCKGLNACKGQGFSALSKADCTAQGGKLSDPKA